MNDRRNSDRSIKLSIQVGPNKFKMYVSVIAP